MASKQWTIYGGRALGPAPFLLMGVLNLSPESFSDAARGICRQADPATPGGLDSLAAEAKDMISHGAMVLDVGAESTRPGAAPVPEAEESRRILPALTALRQALANALPARPAAHLTAPAAPTSPAPALSVDTYKAGIARAALAAGADIINDISAWEFEPELKEVLLEHRPGYVLMHRQGRPAQMQARPSYHNVVEEVYAFLEGKLEELVRGGFPEQRVVIDPGIGFGKNLEHNLALLKNIDRFNALGRPLLVGMSYKSFLGELTAAPIAERGPLTMTATALMAARGVWAHRVHDVRAAALALQLAQALTLS